MTSELNLALAYLAGVLTILSPCVLPLVPIVLGGAQSKGRWGPVALGLGLAASFTVIGLFVALIGFSVGLDADVFRVVGGVMMLILGLVLVTPPAQVWLATAGGPVMEWAQGGLSRFEGGGAWSQAGLGAMLGLVWALRRTNAGGGVHSGRPGTEPRAGDGNNADFRVRSGDAAGADRPGLASGPRPDAGTDGSGRIDGKNDPGRADADHRVVDRDRRGSAGRDLAGPGLTRLVDDTHDPLLTVVRFA